MMWELDFHINILIQLTHSSDFWGHFLRVCVYFEILEPKLWCRQSKLLSRPRSDRLYERYWLGRTEPRHLAAAASCISSSSWQLTWAFRAFAFVFGSSVGLRSALVSANAAAIWTCSLYQRIIEAHASFEEEDAVNYGQAHEGPRLFTCPQTQ